MAKHLDTGRTGEAMAVAYFQEQGYRILHQNWRHAHWEVDIIAEKDQVLHFIEVKTRRSRQFGFPEDNVDEKKIRNLINAGEEYMYQNPQWKRIQFNILAISILRDEPVEYFFIADVYV